MIFCFSGTGNSRYLAERIAEALQEPVVNMNEKIKLKDCTSLQTGQNVIIVVPTYAWRIPRIVSEWLLKTELQGAERIWFVMDCGSEIGNAAEYNRRLAEQKNLRYMGTAQIIMPENYIAMFGAPGPDEARRIAAEAEPDILEVISRIASEQTFDAMHSSFIDRFKSGPVNPIFYSFFVKASPFCAGSTCTGCGQCVKRCPMNNIRLEKRKPVWGSECTHCMACICYCPAEAIEYGKKSIGKPRYHFDKL